MIFCERGCLIPRLSLTIPYWSGHQHCSQIQPMFGNACILKYYVAAVGGYHLKVQPRSPCKTKARTIWFSLVHFLQTVAYTREKEGRVGTLGQLTKRSKHLVCDMKFKSQDHNVALSTPIQGSMYHRDTYVDMYPYVCACIWSKKKKSGHAWEDRGQPGCHSLGTVHLVF